MRRDYFICIFLMCICASLFFVCFLPLYFEYGIIVPREITILESVFSWVFASLVLIIIPLYSAIFKKFWFSLGLASYGVLAIIPERILPSLINKVHGDDAALVSVVENYVLRELYGMVKAPFAGLVPALGDNMAVKLSGWILPISLGSYAVVQIFRFYRDAYVADQLDPSRVMDSTAKENNREAAATRIREAKNADILGTVISAPVKASSKKMETTHVVPSNPQAPKPSAVASETRQVVAPPKASQAPSVGSETKVIHLGPPKNN